MTRTVAIVGMSKSTREDAPWDNHDIEIWALNESYAFASNTYLPRIDRIFQLHPREDFMRPENHNDRYHPQWLLNEPFTEAELKWFRKRNKAHLEENNETILYPFDKQPGDLHRDTNLPIYMQQVFDDIPGSIEYPREAAKQLMKHFVRGPEDEVREFYTATIPWMIAFALLQDDISRIEIYGVEAMSETEYAYQRDSIHFWVGLGAGLGKTIWVPDACSIGHGQVYGYEMVRSIPRSFFKNEVGMLQAEENRLRVALENSQAVLRAMMEKRNVPEDEFVKARNKNMWNIAKLNVIYGAKMHAKGWISKYDYIIRQYCELELNQLRPEEEKAKSRLNNASGIFEQKRSDLIAHMNKGKDKPKLRYLEQKAQKAEADMIEWYSRAHYIMGARQHIQKTMARLDMKPVSDEYHEILLMGGMKPDEMA